MSNLATFIARLTTLALEAVVRIQRRHSAVAGYSVLAVLLMGCPPGKPITTSITNVGLAVGTVVKTSGIIDVTNNCSTAAPPAPDPQAFFNNLSPSSKLFPFVGFEIWRNTFDGCTTTRLDVYRALVTFNMAGVSQLKGLVKSATLGVTTRALPSGVGAHASCISFIGGAGTLERFGPAVTVAPVAANGVLQHLQPTDAFPGPSQTVFVFPKPWVAGAVAGATNATTSTASGTGGASFTVDVTTQVTAAINGGFPSMSWMLTSALEGPLSGISATSVDCKTSYRFDLAIEHY